MADTDKLSSDQPEDFMYIEHISYIFKMGAWLAFVVIALSILTTTWQHPNKTELPLSELWKKGDVKDTSRPDNIDNILTIQLQPSPSKRWDQQKGNTLLFSIYTWTDDAGLGGKNPQLSSISYTSSEYEIRYAKCEQMDSSGRVHKCTFTRGTGWNRNIDVSQDISGEPRISCKSPAKGSPETTTQASEKWEERDIERFLPNTCSLQYILDIDINPNPFRPGKSVTIGEIMIYNIFKLAVVLGVIAIFPTCGMALILLMMSSKDSLDGGIWTTKDD